MTPISIIASDKSILIGEPTGGYTTTNLRFKLNEYSVLNLAVDYASDRNSKIYPKNINPDILVLNGDNFEFLNNVKFRKNQNIFFFTTLPKMFSQPFIPLISINKKISARSMPEMLCSWSSGFQTL